MTTETTSLPPHFDPDAIEPKLVARWLDTNVGRADVDSPKPKFSIVMPPPNVTGQLHIGHALDMTLQDVVVRNKRQRGFDVLWLPGTDHASIATHFVIERELAKTNNTRFTLGREAFLERAALWKDQSAGAIQGQLRRLGCTPDWSRESFTLNPDITRAVVRVFVQLYREGLIYRGSRLVNWDPKFRTAISDLEVETREVEGHLWFIRYPLADDPSRSITVSTTRPETLFGDQAVAVNAEDPRYRDLVGRRVVLPLTGRTIPVIADEHADPEQGTGAVKITPAHDFNDHEVGLRHGLEPLDVMTPDARLNDAVPEAFRGLDRFEARDHVVAALEAIGALEKIESKVIAQPFGDRSGVVVEPRITDQWFLQTTDLAAAAAAAVRDGRTRFVPANWANVFFRWMDNIKPWCISRQLWYGHEIPAWYGPDREIFVADTAEEALAAARAHYGRDDVVLERDPDILDTWFSSALQPFATLGWPDETPDLARYYPTDLLVTGFDIIFFWVSRMMMQGLKLRHDVPFRDIYIHGLVRDAAGQKMSKTKGNVIDPLDLIAQHGADATRFTLMAMCGHGQDIRMSADAVRGARLFANKLWNASRFAAMNRCFEGDAASALPAPGGEINAWVVSGLVEVARATTLALDEYRFNDASLGLQAFVRDTFCDWFIEFAKIAMNGDDPAAATETRAVIAWCLRSICQLLNPFMPFITEELWDGFGGGVAMTAAQLPDFDAVRVSRESGADVEFVIALITRIRSVRNELKIAPGKPLPLLALTPSAGTRRRLQTFGPHLRRLAHLGAIEETRAVPDGAVRMSVEDAEMLLSLAGIVDFAKEKQRLEKELKKLDGDLQSLDRRLSDPAFLDKADADVIAKNRARQEAGLKERERLADAIALL